MTALSCGLFQQEVGVMRKEGWVFFISTSLMSFVLTVFLMWFLGFYTIDVAIWRKILATAIVPGSMMVLVWLLARRL